MRPMPSTVSSVYTYPAAQEHPVLFRHLLTLAFQRLNGGLVRVGLPTAAHCIRRDKHDGESRISTV